MTLSARKVAPTRCPQGPTTATMIQFAADSGHNRQNCSEYLRDRQSWLWPGPAFLTLAAVALTPFVVMLAAMPETGGTGLLLAEKPFRGLRGAAPHPRADRV
jgi:hypothetical protein